jgi:hypothetical protein
LKNTTHELENIAHEPCKAAQDYIITCDGEAKPWYEEFIFAKKLSIQFVVASCISTIENPNEENQKQNSKIRGSIKQEVI